MFSEYSTTPEAHGSSNTEQRTLMMVGHWEDCWLVGRERLRAKERVGAGHHSNSFMFLKIYKRDSSGYLQKVQLLCRASWPAIWNIWICNNTFLLEIIRTKVAFGFLLFHCHQDTSDYIRCRDPGQMACSIPRLGSKEEAAFFYNSCHLGIRFF